MEAVKQQQPERKIELNEILSTATMVMRSPEYKGSLQELLEWVCQMANLDCSAAINALCTYQKENP